MKASRTSVTSRRNVANEGDDESFDSGEIRCGCQCLVKTLTSSTSSNPGRRFLRCPNYKDPGKCCNYFQWIDPKVPNDSNEAGMSELHTKVKHQNKGYVEDGMVDYKKELKRFLEESARNQTILLSYSRCLLVLIGIVLVLLLVLLKKCM